eukprot:m.78845 g.78845  ORF g.78845 m.78845 type:complete len:117 (-) comp10752_c0_seq1:12-362(-)
MVISFGSTVMFHPGRANSCCIAGSNSLAVAAWSRAGPAAVSLTSAIVPDGTEMAAIGKPPPDRNDGSTADAPGDTPAHADTATAVASNIDLVQTLTTFSKGNDVRSIYTEKPDSES